MVDQQTAADILVDPEDAHWLEGGTWTVTGHKDRGTLYAVRRFSNPRRMVLLHRAIMGAKPGEQVDHRNGNGLDNRRRNLRVTDHAMNQQNRRGLDKKNTSGVRGVRIKRYKTVTSYQARANVNGQSFFVGTFRSMEEASAAIHEWRLANMPGYLPSEVPA